jgi:formate dehydrogenase subunit delta
MKTTGEKLVYMANQIAAFFVSQPQAEAAAGLADHINKFWDPRMRAQLFAILDEGGEGLSPLVLDAAPQIHRPKVRAEV